MWCCSGGGWQWAWLALGLAALARAQLAQNCPPRNELDPCVCTPKKNGLDILCEFTDLTHISKAMAVLKGKPSIIIFYLKLRHNNLPKLQSFVFLGIDIRHLTIHNSSLSVIEESSLSSMGHRWSVLFSCLLVPDGLSEDPVRRERHGYRRSTLTGCYQQRCRWLGKGLTQLDLSQNKLSTVPSPAFRNLHHLLILNMNHNRITALHSKAFEGLDTLEILTLYENKISTIEADSFKGLDKKLKRLNLGGNKLTSIPQEAFSILDTLKKLELQENSITSISEGDFAGLKNLDSLGLAHNHLREVPARVFSHLTLLNSLELDGNQITHIDVDAFAGLDENLQYLRLGDNNLHEIPSEALRRLHRLRHLDLRANNITVIAEDAFTGYGDSITFLNLQKNDIKILPAMAFDNLNSLETLNLQNNKLTHIPEEIMEPVVDTLRVVDIMDNPLICDCQLRWFSDWLKNLKDKDDEMMQKKRTMCTMMPDHQEYYVQKLPLDKMNCVSKSLVRGGASAAARACVLPTTILAVACAAHSNSWT